MIAREGEARPEMELFVKKWVLYFPNKSEILTVEMQNVLDAHVERLEARTRVPRLLYRISLESGLG